jgi:uncharacterized protein YcfL
MKKFFSLAVALMLLIPCTGCAFAWENTGAINGTDIEYSEMSVSKGGVDVRLTNTSAADVKVSLKVSFFDKEGNSIGHSIVGLREIQAGASVGISGNYLTGNWRQCRDARRMTWEKMTYELIY